MNVPTITMPKAEALEAFREYQEAARLTGDPEDIAIARGFKALSQGRQVLNLQDAFRAAGVDELGRPRLAICSAVHTEVRCRLSWGRESARFYWGKAIDHRWGGIKWAATRSMLLVRDVLPVRRQPRGEDLRAITPNVPPRLRPASSLRRFHVLWEVEEWETVPADPMLLRRLGGDLWAVLAVWDLTELERAVLAGTRALQ